MKKGIKEAIIKKIMKSLNKKEEQWLLEEKYNGIKNLAFLKDLKKLKSGTPLAYLIGNVEFLNCTIDLFYKPLIPRSETEFWVDEFIKKYKKARSCLDVLDIFSGSGCIGIAVLKNLQNTKVDFAEKNPQYIKQIQKNLKINSATSPGCCRVYESDVFENIPEKKYDTILANPPYIAKKEKKNVQKTVLENEDHKALFTKDNGLYFIKKIITEGQKYLKPNGEIWIEFDPWQIPLIKNFLKEKGIQNYKFWIDQYGRKRTLIITKDSN